MILILINSYRIYFKFKKLWSNPNRNFKTTSVMKTKSALMTYYQNICNKCVSQPVIQSDLIQRARRPLGSLGQS